MFAVKIQSKFIKPLVAALLVLFVLSKMVGLLHGYSHHDTTSENSLLAKIFFEHKNSSGDKAENCLLCAFANSQNQAALNPNLIFTAAFFYVIFILRFFDRVKLSYLLASKAPRGPPTIS